MAKYASFVENIDKLNQLLVSGYKVNKQLTKFLEGDKCEVDGACYFQDKYLKKVKSCIGPVYHAKSYLSECVNGSSKCADSILKYDQIKVFAGECFFNWMYDLELISDALLFDFE